MDPSSAQVNTSNKKELNFFLTISTDALIHLISSHLMSLYYNVSFLTLIHKKRHFCPKSLIINLPNSLQLMSLWPQRSP